MRKGLLKKLCPEIQENFPDGILVLDIKTMEILDMNNTVLDMLGYEKDELFGKKIFMLHPVEERYLIETLVKSMGISQTRYFLEIPFVRKDRGGFFVDIACKIIKHDGHPVAVGFIRDRTRLSSKATSWNLLYKHISEMVNCGICLVTAHRIVYANQFIAEMFGATSTLQIIGKKLMDFIPEEKRDEHKRDYESVTSGIRPIVISRYTFKRFEGWDFEVYCKMSRVLVHGKWTLEVILFTPGMDFKRGTSAHVNHDLQGEPVSVGQLTEREIEILRLIASGCTVKEIAGRLKIARRTVRTHKRNIMNKLNLHSSADLTRFAIKNHIVSIE